MRMRLGFVILPMMLAACAGEGLADSNDPIDECVFCGDERADAFGIARESYLAYGIVNVANSATLAELDDDVPLDGRAARGIVDQRPFDYIEEVDTVAYVGRSAFFNLARYAQDNGFVPSCGDGGLQPLLESCDDGNLTSGDGCSATCQLEGGVPTSIDLADLPDLITGRDIGVPQVDDSAYYLRRRELDAHPFPDGVVALFDRADGIVANEQADGFVRFDELAILSKSPFYDSLLADERAAVDQAWEYFRVSSAPVVDIDPVIPDFVEKVGHETEIVRPGPLVVGPRPYFELSYSAADHDLFRRIQQMPGLNLDNDPDTMEVHDIDKTLTDYTQVFTRAELATLEDVRFKFFEGLEEIESGGDYVIKFDFFPEHLEETDTIVAFDGYEFRWRTIHHLLYEANEGWNSYPTDRRFSATLYGDWRFHPELLVNGSESDCGGYEECYLSFFHEAVSYRKLDDTAVPRGSSAGRQHVLKDLVLMEHWEGDQRIYNRVLNFKRNLQHKHTLQALYNKVAARPMMADGTLLSIQHYKSVSGSDFFEPYEVTAPVNEQLHKMLRSTRRDLAKIKPGRYEEFEGVVLDVHESKAMVAYYDGAELPLDVRLSKFSTRKDRDSIWVSFEDGEPTLHVKKGWSGTEMKAPLGGDEPDAVELDASYYVITR